MSYSIQRSQSVPYPFPSLKAADKEKHLPQRALSTLQLAKPNLSTPYGHTQSLAHHKFGRRNAPGTPGLTPRDEREDAFNLSGFFPTAESSKWAREEEVDEQSSDEEAEDTFSTHVSDEVAQSSINQEDKLGVLSLKTDMFSSNRVGREDRLMSPYAGYDAVDDESLCQSYRLQSRKQAPSRFDNAPASTKTGSLFSPEGDDNILDGNQGFLWKLLG